MSRFRLVLLLLIGAVFVAASSGSEASPGAVKASANPLQGLKFFVDQEAPSWLAWRRASGRTKDLLWKIAREPKFAWFGAHTRPPSQFRLKVRKPIEAAEEDGSVALLALLRAESNQCSPTYQGGGPGGDAATRAWYDKFADAIGDSQVVIAFEPDSLGTIRCHAKSRRDDRIRLLRYGVTKLSELPNAIVYLEAAASDWTAPGITAKLLRKIGIAKVRGFMLNVTHFDWTAANIRHGLKISRLTGGKHFIINTAQNGRGPVTYRKAGQKFNLWCNPGLRGLGPPPTTNTSNPKVDAYFWIARPGFAQSCQGRPIGWYLPRALTLARFATNWEKAPPGTYRGHRKRYPPSAFNIPR